MSSSNGRRLNVFKRLRWAADGKKKMMAVIPQISGLNDQLYEMLTLAKQEEVHDSLHALMRDAVSRCTSASKIIELRGFLQPDSSTDAAAICAAMRVRNMQLLLSAGANGTSATGGLTEQEKVRNQDRLDIDKLVVSHKSPYRGLEVCRYEDGAILVEWQHVREGGEARWTELQ